MLALEDFDLDDPAGAFFGLLGPNGAGKTTLISAVCNLMRVTDGRDRGVRRAARLACRRARWVGLAEQDINLDRFLTVARRSSTTAATSACTTTRPSERADEMIEVFGLEAKRDVRAPQAVGRPAPAAAAGPRADAPAAPGDPRRAHGGRGLRAAHRALALHPPAARRGHHDPAHDALPRGGRGALRGDRAHPRRPADRPRHGRRPARALRRRPARGRLRQGDGRRDRASSGSAAARPCACRSSGPRRCWPR